MSYKKQLLIYPNPAYSSATIQLISENEWVKIELIDMQGKVVQTPIDKVLQKQEHSIVLDLNDLRAGIYRVNVYKESGNSSTQLNKIK